MKSSFYVTARDAAISGVLALMQQRDYRDNLRGIGFLVLVPSLFLVATIFLALGFSFLLRPIYGSGMAFGITGGLVLVVALFFLYIGSRLLRTKNVSSPPYSQDELTLLIDGITRDLETEMKGSVQENPKTAVATVALAGFLAGKGFLCR